MEDRSYLSLQVPQALTVCVIKSNILPFPENSATNTSKMIEKYSANNDEAFEKSLLCFFNILSKEISFFTRL